MTTSPANQTLGESRKGKKRGKQEDGQISSLKQRRKIDSSIIGIYIGELYHGRGQEKRKRNFTKEQHRIWTESD